MPRTHSKAELTVKEMVDQIISDGVMTQAEYMELLQAIEADGAIDAEESQQISRLISMIQKGDLRVM